MLEYQSNDTTSVMYEEEVAKTDTHTSIKNVLDKQKYERYNQKKINEIYDEIDHDLRMKCLNPKVLKCETTKFANW